MHINVEQYTKHKCIVMWTLLKCIKNNASDEKKNIWEYTHTHTPHQYYLKKWGKKSLKTSAGNTIIIRMVFWTEKWTILLVFWFHFHFNGVSACLCFVLYQSVVSILIFIDYYVLLRNILHFFLSHSDCFWSWLKCYQILFYIFVTLIEVYVLYAPCNKK